MTRVSGRLSSLSLRRVGAPPALTSSPPHIAPQRTTNYCNRSHVIGLLNRYIEVAKHLPDKPPDSGSLNIKQVLDADYAFA
jgi:hypothetical protein